MYGFSTKLKMPFYAALMKVTEALQNEGFGILSDIDVEAALMAKLNVDIGPYRILGACNPRLTYAAIGADPDIGLLLPCNILLREVEDGVVVGFMDPAAVLQLVDKPELHELGREVRSRLERVRDNLAAARTTAA